jgi:hypothetical protein
MKRKKEPEGERIAPTSDENERLIGAIKNAPHHGNLARLPDFGIGHPSIKEAAELVAIDMWYSGGIGDISELEDFDGSDRDPRLKAALVGAITAFEARLLTAIDGGRLKAPIILRDLDDRLIPQETYVSYDDLVEWMHERGLSPGDHMASWLSTESTISELICEEVASLRAASMTGEQELTKIVQQKAAAKYGMLDESEELEEVREVLKAKVQEIHRLEEKLAEHRSAQPAKVDRPLHTRQRRTLLTVIAALCSQTGIEHDGRGAAQRIKRATELIGAPIDDGTIDSILKEIPDALETRMK